MTRKLPKPAAEGTVILRESLVEGLEDSPGLLVSGPTLPAHSEALCPFCRNRWAKYATSGIYACGCGQLFFYREARWVRVPGDDGKFEEWRP